MSKKNLKRLDRRVTRLLVWATVTLFLYLTTAGAERAESHDLYFNGAAVVALHEEYTQGESYETLLKDITASLFPPCFGIRVEKKGWGKDNSGIQNKAFEISGCDKDFVHLLDRENGQWTANRRHNPGNNVIGVDYGLCGINKYWHPHIVNDPRFLDEDWQLAKCYELYKGGTRFYGADKGPSPNITFHG